MLSGVIGDFLKQKKKIILTVSGIIFFAYLCLMIWEVFIGPYRSYSGIRRYNLYPFKTITYYFINSKHFGFHILFINLAANIVTFIPLGFFSGLFFKSFKKTAIAILRFILIITGIELMQLILNVGVFDVDDIILNTLGCTIGFMIYKVIRRNL